MSSVKLGLRLSLSVSAYVKVGVSMDRGMVGVASVPVYEDTDRDMDERRQAGTCSWKNKITVHCFQRELLPLGTALNIKEVTVRS